MRQRKGKEEKLNVTHEQEERSDRVGLNGILEK